MFSQQSFENRNFHHTEIEMRDDRYGETCWSSPRITVIMDLRSPK